MRFSRTELFWLAVLWLAFQQAEAEYREFRALLVRELEIFASKANELLFRETPFMRAIKALNGVI
jgi:hypothetical protein